MLVNIVKYISTQISLKLKHLKGMKIDLMGYLINGVKKPGVTNIKQVRQVERNKY